MSRNIIKEYDEIRLKNNLKPLPIKLYKEKDKEKVIFFAISKYIPRVWTDLDKQLKILKKEQITSRTAKLNTNSRKLMTIPALEAIKEDENQDFDSLDKLTVVVANVIRNLLKGNKEKVKKTLKTLETENGRLMLTVVSAYCLGEELLNKFGSIEASKKLEVTIKTKKNYEKELRKIFKNNDFETAIQIFSEMVADYGERILVKTKEISQLLEEEYLYTIADEESINRFLIGISEKIREDITGQPRLLIEELE